MGAAPVAKTTERAAADALGGGGAVVREEGERKMEVDGKSGEREGKETSRGR